MKPMSGAAGWPAKQAPCIGVPMGPDEPTDPRALSMQLRRVIEGDREAKGWVYETFSPRLFKRLRARYARGAGGLDAEELLHDAFLSLFQHGGTLASFVDHTPADEQTGARFDNFLWNHACGIASNRRRSLKRQALEPFPAVEPGSGSADPERESISRDTLTRLQECLEKRGRRIYLYYKLRFCDGLTPEEIAHATGWSRKATYKLKLALTEAVGRCAERLGIS